MKDSRVVENRNIYVTFTTIIQFVLVGSFLYFCLYADWFNAFLTALVIIINLFPVLLYWNYQIFVPPEFQLLAIFFIFTSIFLGSVVDFYYTFWWWDIALHMCSGFLLGLIGFVVLFYLNKTNTILRHMTPIFICFFAVIFAVFLGVLWEIYEFVQDLFIPAMDMQNAATGVGDTMIDLIVDMIGAIVVSSMGYIYLKTGRYSFIADGIRSFITHNPTLFRSKTKKE